MLIMLYLAATSMLPRIAQMMWAITEPVAVMAITILGVMVILSSLLGVKMFRGMGTSVFGAVVHAVGFLIRTLVRAAGWLANQVARLLPRVYRATYRSLKATGMKSWLVTLLSMLVTILVLAIII